MQMFERDIPGENTAGYSGQSISQLPLETCQTMNGMWGYKVVDQEYKSTSTLLRLLVRTAAKGANLLLNIGPQPNGELPATALNRLHEMGQWLNGPAGESIYTTVAGEVALGDSIVSTRGRKNGALYLHILTQNPQTTVTIPYAKKIRSVSSLTDKNAKITYKRHKKDGTVTFTLPQMQKNEVDYILKIE